jgi:hypothetical protein
MKLLPTFILLGCTSTLVASWTLQIDRDRLSFSGDRRVNCQTIDGNRGDRGRDGRDDRGYRRYNWDGRDNGRDGDGRRGKDFCVTLYSDYDCRNIEQDVCGNGSGETRNSFVSFSVDRERN